MVRRIGRSGEKIKIEKKQNFLERGRNMKTKITGRCCVYTLVVFATIVFLAPAVLAQGKTYEFKLGHVFATTNANHPGALKYAEEVGKRTKGAVKINVFPAGQLGGDRELYEGIQRGTLEMGLVNQGSASGFDRRLEIGALPFLTKDYETADRQFFKGEMWIGKEMAKYCLEKGLRILAHTENDFRHLTNSRRPVKTVADIKGLKIRVPEAPLMVTCWKALGAIVTPISFPELYTALQQKTVDGQENGILLTYSSKLYEVQPYMTLIKYMYSTPSFMISEKVWRTLPADIQKTLQETAVEVAAFTVDLNRKEVQKCRAEMEKAGVQIIDMDPKERAKLREIALESWKSVEPYVAKDVMERLKKEAAL